MEIIGRDIEEEVINWLDRKEIIAIRGSRQCGKTTLLKKIKKVLKERGIDEKFIHYITFEDDIEKERFEKNPKDYFSIYLKDLEKQFFLLDEVQYVSQAGKLLKLVFDEIENIKIIITGSSTMDLNEIGSFLVGRVILFEMYPFSFSEFLSAKDENLYKYYNLKKISLYDKKIKLEELIFIDKLNLLLKEYLTFGGYPAIVLEKDIEKKKILLKNLFQTYIEKDVVKIYGSKYSKRIADLIRYLASVNSSMINYNETSSLIGLYDKEIKEILHILEATYIVRLVKPYFKNLTTELRKNPKVYFIDTGLRNASVNRYEFNDQEYGELLENYVFCTFKEHEIKYWRTTAKAEVDFIIDGEIPIESKATPKLTRSLRSFISSYKSESAFLLNLNNLRTELINNTKIFIVPFSLVGKSIKSR